MVLLDTSVLIDVFNGRSNRKTAILGEIIRRNVPFGISSYSYQEALQGATNERDYKTIREYLNSQALYFLPESRESYENAARMYYNLRRRGITIRGQTDILIARTAIENDLVLLHNDRDFDAMAKVVKELRILDSPDAFN